MTAVEKTALAPRANGKIDGTGEGVAPVQVCGEGVEDVKTAGEGRMKGQRVREDRPRGGVGTGRQPRPERSSGKALLEWWWACVGWGSMGLVGGGERIGWKATSAWSKRWGRQ